MGNWNRSKFGPPMEPGGEVEKIRAIELLHAIDEHRLTNRIRTEAWLCMGDLEFQECCAYRHKPDGKPYPWQVQWHNAGKHYRERAILANNQSGKTRTCGLEVAIHATGLYPPWWDGHRFVLPPKICIGSQTNETLRDPQQIELYGDFQPESRLPSGKGWVPLDCIQEISFRQCGLAGVYDEVSVKHVSGGVSLIKHKTYEQGWTKWQGTQFDLYWLDEEPENDDRLYSEVLRGVLKRGGHIIVSRTPLFGMTRMVQHFMDGSEGVYYKNVTIDETPHMTPEDKKAFIAGIPDHELDARLRGLPMLGEGLIYPVGDDVISCQPFHIPRYYKQIIGLDFGSGHGDSSHPTAIVWMAYDADSDVVYVTDVYKQSGQPIAVHAKALSRHGGWQPIAWPHDGLKTDKGGGGASLMEMYRSYRLNTLDLSARYDDKKGGGQPREPVIQDIYERMLTGRLKVFKHLELWFEEKRMYHRKDGKVVAVKDDLMSATNYALMMLRYSRAHYIQHKQAYSERYEPAQQYVSIS